MRLFALPVLVLITAAPLLAEQPAELAADNGILKVKLDLTRGGAICYLSPSGSERNLVNIFDEGRYIQQSYYAGKALDRKAEGQSPKWSPWCWNPIQVGDEFRNRAKILEYRHDGDSLFVKCIPMQWDMNNRPAEAEMEQRVLLIGNVLQVRCKLVCHRTDTVYGEGELVDQELPAVYPISALYRLYAYLGQKPFTLDTLSALKVNYLQEGFWGRYPAVGEHWMAFVDAQGWGMGVYNAHCSEFLAGIAGQAGGEATSGATSYIAPLRKEALGRRSVYDYEYAIIVGQVDEIRQRVYQLHRRP
ncbi:MAG TPA: hypothetical protein PKI62_04565 [bacterium]|nr:hypothetical protein [bacterium]HPR89441.1 hypothetical protein [bacterium]